MTITDYNKAYKQPWERLLGSSEEDVIKRLGEGNLLPSEYVYFWVSLTTIEHGKILDHMKEHLSEFQELLGIVPGYSEVDSEKLECIVDQLIFVPASGNKLEQFINEDLKYQWGNEKKPYVIPAFQIVGLNSEGLSSVEAIGKFMDYFTKKEDCSIGDILFYFKTELPSIDGDLTVEGDPTVSRRGFLLKEGHLKCKEGQTRGEAINNKFKRFEMSVRNLYSMIEVYFSRENEDYKSMLIPHKNGLVVSGALQPDILYHVASNSKSD